MKKLVYIDKTIELEKGLEAFPSIYIEGAVASGKTIAVKMLLEHHPEVDAVLLDMKTPPSKETLVEMLELCSEKMSRGVCWVIFENLNKSFPIEYAELIAAFISNMPKAGRVIMVSRDRPQKVFLELMWKRQMELISQMELRFDHKEIGQMIDNMNSPLKPDEVYVQTGGWAGCVDMMVRMSLKNGNDADAKSLRNSYEIDHYIQSEILGVLSDEERDLFWKVSLCPLVNEAFCEDVWNIPNVRELLQDMGRKGIFRYDKSRRCWKLTRMFRNQEIKNQAALSLEEFWEESGKWYEKNGYIREALECFREMKQHNRYGQCMVRHFEQVPFLEMPYEEVLHWKENSPEICYMRGMYYYSKRDLKGLDREIEKLEKLNQPGTDEILLNMYFAKPDYPPDDWLEMLEDMYKNAESEVEKSSHMRLYHILGTSCTFLCGIRDLTELFACSKKEENRKARLWKSCLGEWEWKCYQLARMDYYLETLRNDTIHQGDWDVLLEKNSDKKQSGLGVDEEQLDLVRLYLLGKLHRSRPSQEYTMMFHSIGTRMIQMGTPVYARNAEAIINLYSPWQGEPEHLTRWLRYKESEARENVTEETTTELWCMAKGYLLLNQYEKAEKILRVLIPYQQTYRRARVLAEACFLQAIISWARDRKGRVLQNMIESFLISNAFRYVDFYTFYGKRGREVLEVYMEWHLANFPEGWRRKKKYQYGNVLRMPLEDYMGTVMRCVRKGERSSQPLRDDAADERLTMMELLILQKIKRGLSNQEICEELNLKMPTVKSHIYNMYKKLGVNNRMQAVIKGKETGVLE